MNYKNTQLNVEDVIKHLQDSDSLSKWSSDIRQISSSRDNLVFLDADNTIIIRLSLNKRLSEVETETAFISFLENNHIPVAKVKLATTIEIGSEEYPVALFKYIDHEPTDIQNVSNHQIEQAAKQLATIHEFGKEFAREHNTTWWADITSDIDKLSEAIRGGQFKDANNKDLFAADLKWAKDFYAEKIADAAGPITILHNDYRIQNVLFDSDQELVGVIDFDYALASPFYVKDAAHAAMEWSFAEGTATPDIDKFNCFIEAYESQSKIKLNDLREWVMYAAINDAAHYILSYPDRQQQSINSYMYDKFLYFRDKYTEVDNV